MKLLIAILGLTLVQIQCFLKKETEQTYQQYLESLAKEINANKNLNWQANEDMSMYKNISKQQADKQNGAKSYRDIPQSLKLQNISQKPIVADNIPENFDAREAWPDCPSIREIRNQGGCGSCWSFGGAEAFTDRWCIASGQKDQDVRLSTENLLSCCDFCGNGCKGGYNPMVWNYFQNTGIVTGNNYGDKDYCQSYSISPTEHGVAKNDSNEIKTPTCKYTCEASYKAESYAQNLYFTNSTGLIIDKDIKAIQTEIMTNGPVEVLFFVYDDFRSYKSGVYKHTGGGLGGGHAVKMLGWGVENGEPYWLCANSWGYDWGDNGFFKILRGNDECGIEHEITYGQPDIERNRVL